MSSQTRARVILSAEEIQRAVRRLAHEILERNNDLDDLILVGMRTRGVPLAQRLAAAIAELKEYSVPVGSLDIGLYRDDLNQKALNLSLRKSDIAADTSGRRVILVDDVLFTGRSIRAALDALIDFGRPAQVQLAVLVDRGHRELPIRPDYVGKNIPTSPDEDVRVHLAEVDGRDEVVVTATKEFRP